MERLTSSSRCREVTDSYPDDFTFDAEEWFSKEENYALIDGDNIAFGEYKSPGVYWVHFCFGSARGREAVELTKEMFSVFCKACPVRIGIGLISVSNKKARWLIRQVGFSSLGVIETPDGLREMFFKTSEE